MHWMASCPEEFDLFTDHKNLIFLFNHLSLARDLNLSSLRKSLSWAVRFCAYNYICIHTNGEENAWVDLLC